MSQGDNGEGKTTEAQSVMPIPDAALQTIGEQIEAAGGEWQEPP